MALAKFGRTPPGIVALLLFLDPLAGAVHDVCTWSSPLNQLGSDYRLDGFEFGAILFRDLEVPLSALRIDILYELLNVTRRVGIDEAQISVRSLAYPSRFLGLGKTLGPCLSHEHWRIAPGEYQEQSK